MLYNKSKNKVSRHKHSHIYIGVLLLALIVVPVVVFAKGINVGFGGKVISTQIPTVTCTDTTGVLVVLGSNIGSLASTFNKKDNDLDETVNKATGLYGAIPYFFKATPGKKKPKVGDWVLGNHKIEPSLKDCTTNALGAPIPIPTFNPVKYGVSK
jgi:hypothetical protein